MDVINGNEFSDVCVFFSFFSSEEKKTKTKKYSATTKHK